MARVTRLAVAILVFTIAGYEPAFADGLTYSLFDAVPAEALRPMDTDRPNVTNTPHTIDAGHLQIETGLVDYAHFCDPASGSDDSSDMLVLGRMNFRLGLLDRLEANLVVDARDFLWNRDNLARTKTAINGPGDVIAGGKLNLWGDNGSDAPWATALALQPQVKIPAAPDMLGNGHPEYFVGLPFLVNLVDGFHLGLQTVVSQERNLANTGYVTGSENSASLDRVFFEKFDIYLEYASHVTTERGAKSQQTVDLGTTYPMTDDIVLDTGINVGLNRASRAVEWLAGFSVRF